MLPDFAHSLFERFEQESIPLLLAGGWAVCHHGYSRFTHDIDWVCSRANETKAIEIMQSLGFRIAFQAMATRFKHPIHLDLPPVDLIWVSEESFKIMAQDQVKTGRHGTMNVISMQTLLAMKLHALKDNENRKGKDLLDIRHLLDETGHHLNEQTIRTLCARYGPPGAYEMIQFTK
jgi:predicted nucleotidyltransferase component of viral defense system